jgi:hypothetical protein
MAMRSGTEEIEKMDLTGPVKWSIIVQNKHGTD